MVKGSLSLRKHLVVIVIIKVALIVWLRAAYFPRLQDQHLPEDLYPPSISSVDTKESP